MATVQKTVVEAEHRHDSVVMVERSTQRRMVVQPQVAAKPEEGGQREIRPGSRRSAAVERGPRWLPIPPAGRCGRSHPPQEGVQSGARGPLDHRPATLGADR